ncbi:hypothetical protein ELD05_02535 [Caldicellulosiruptor changbaiensis]|uniref:Uncharacterized protein n=2 Tax=Caldicellulosiruptor TaxID=44000 RepID=A0A3T0D3K8_9FIRM|nr:hypothetical protein [Caldicellulosiruptor changbaiensis]AZT89629.1 hypothetical protein ELD05_02535 [Caldicellulosiruptor changbaiensis]
MKAEKIIVLILGMFLILPNTIVLSNNKIEKGYYDYSGKKGSKDITWFTGVQTKAKKHCLLIHTINN